MSGYQPGRRAPNVSQYIAGLNQIPQESDFAQDDSYNFEDDLALFTNTEFIHNDIIDFDLDFDFTQSIPGEEEYLKHHQQLEHHQPQQEQQDQGPSQLEAGNDKVIKSNTTPGDDSQLHNSTPPPPHSLPPPPPPQPKTTSSISLKKQKLSPRSSKSTKQEATLIASAATKTTPTSAQEGSSTSSTSASSSTIPFEHSTANATNTTPGAKGGALSISIPLTSNNSSSLLGQHQTSPSQAGNGDMNFDGEFHFTDIGFTPQGNINNHNIAYGGPSSGYDFNVPPQSPFDPKHQLHTPVTTPPNGQQGVRPQGILPDAAALLEASSRAAAEEDKRRRNTAASARFRYKKKQREQALEKSAKDMTDKLDKLEEKINQLEKENNWLRSLVIERTAKSSEEMAELYKTFKEEERSKDQYKKGVGTSKAEN